ncbi:MAG TPA: ferredoxin [Ruminiclostridium sp.]|jgi:ferredoxin|nr:ferredoxin [Ruminiclostridium sp.]
MKAFIERDGCIACGLCTETCPEVFRFADDGFAEVYVDEIPSGEEEKAVESQENCPTSVITVKE